MAKRSKNEPCLSIIVPYLARSSCIETCKQLVFENTAASFELVEIVDSKDVYAAYNEGAARAKGSILAFLNDDMFVAPGWDQLLVSACEPKSIVTTYLIESGRVPVNHRNIERDFGRTARSFRYGDFRRFCNKYAGEVPEKKVGFGWYMPFAVRREDFIPYPNRERRQPNDALLFGIFAGKGYRFFQVRSFAYHLQRMSQDP